MGLPLPNFNKVPILGVGNEGVGLKPVASPIALALHRAAPRGTTSRSAFRIAFFSVTTHAGNRFSP